jgi:hypothetical protein
MSKLTKNELIYQVLNETNQQLYLFFAKKLLDEYPEYKQKIKDYWLGQNPLYKNVSIGRVEFDGDSLFNGYEDDDNMFYYTPSHTTNMNTSGFLNYILIKDGY